jgi:uncharacterized protein (DUF2249 family)
VGAVEAPEQENPMPTAEAVLDVRELAPRDRHATIFARLAALAGDERLQIVNDHDPKPLWYQLQAEQPGRFEWHYLESGPERWRAQITRLVEGAPAPAAGPAVDTAAPRAAGPYLDNRGLEPPEPMVRILEALNDLAGGAELTAHLDREPLLLYPHLETRGFAHRIDAEADGSYLIHIWREG